MNYRLDNNTEAISFWEAFKGFRPFMKPEWRRVGIAGVTILLNASAEVLAPYLLGQAVDVAIMENNYELLVQISIGLIGVYMIIGLTRYANIQLMGRIGRRVLYRLRQKLFSKIQFLPIAFFNSNKTGDLVARITTDANTINSLFAETLVRLLSSFFIVFGIGVFMVILNPRLGIATLSVAVGLFIITRVSNAILQRLNKKSLDTAGEFSADVQEQIENMKAVIAFGRRDYFVFTLEEQSQVVYKATRMAGIANSIIAPLYRFAGQITQIVVLIYGLYLLGQDAITIGLLVSYFAYARRFFEPLRIIASLWANVQKSIAAWKRLVILLSLKNNLPVLEPEKIVATEQCDEPIMQFHNVSFGYDSEKYVLHNATICIQPGTTVAVVGPTGGGKSTTAALMMRLYDVQEGSILLNGKDIRGYTPEEIAKEVGFILQDPVLFSGSVGMNIAMGHPEFTNGYNEKKLSAIIDEMQLGTILEKFPEGLATEVNLDSDSLSLGQQQLVAFMRAVIRKPKLLILDEATANVDTVTEKQLNHILEQLRNDIAMVVIAHRLNTIESADEIIFIQGGRVKKAMSFQDALTLIDSAQSSS